MICCKNIVDITFIPSFNLVCAIFNSKRKKRICLDLELIYNFGKFKSNEQNYIIFEKKKILLAIKIAIKSFHIYVAVEDYIIRNIK